MCATNSFPLTCDCLITNNHRNQIELGRNESVWKKINVFANNREVFFAISITYDQQKLVNM